MMYSTSKTMKYLRTSRRQARRRQERMQFAGAVAFVLIVTPCICLLALVFGTLLAGANADPVWAAIARLVWGA